MSQNKQPSLITLIMMISFASVNAVLFTPALPQITQYFKVSANIAQLTISIFLVGYTLGQLIYGPLANRFGRKPALLAGVSLQIIAAISCALSSYTNSFQFLLWSRLFLALGSCVGLKMTLTLVSEYYDLKKGMQILSYAMLAFAITPSIGTAIGGVLSEYFGFASCFYFLAFYGAILAFRVTKLTETLQQKDLDALNLKNIIAKYIKQSEVHLLRYAVVMGCATAIVYLWAEVSPFLAIRVLHLSENQYGFWNIIPSIGMILGFLISSKLVHIFTPVKNIKIGVIITLVGILIMFIGFILKPLNEWTLFIPMIIIFLGEALVLNNSASYATAKSSDKSNSSALLSFINMGVATICVLVVNVFGSTSVFLMPIFCFILVGIIWVCKE
jgi:MFS transporter, DHA1 family, multidrug resistance protein